jgi:hypothetical protein
MALCLHIGVLYKKFTVSLLGQDHTSRNAAQE